jgi:XTP/dITP diphosphohydrolase
MNPAAPHLIVIASRNANKVREIAAVLGAADAPAALRAVRWLSLAEAAPHAGDPVEDQPTFAGNAALKARHASRLTGLWTLADDSGLEVDALDGAPGVLSARYAGLAAGVSGGRNPARAEKDLANNRKLIAALAGVPAERRTARFRCCLALADGERILLTAEGGVEGRIIDAPRGSGGFGYDPHFLIPELGRTMAELGMQEKNRISHRGRALRQLRERLAALLD